MFCNYIALKLLLLLSGTDSSIRSLSAHQDANNYMTTAYDGNCNDSAVTATESIFDKINNITGGLNVTLSADRIICRLRINKDAVAVGDVPSINDGANHNHNRYTLGISIIQGTDNNVYVKDLTAGGPGERAGVQVGDQIIAVDGVSLLTLPYGESLRRLQQTGRVVILVLSQIFQKQKQRIAPGLQQQPDVDYMQRIRYETTDVDDCGGATGYRSDMMMDTRNEVKKIGGASDVLRDRYDDDDNEWRSRSLSAAKSLPDLPQVSYKCQSTSNTEYTIQTYWNSIRRICDNILQMKSSILIEQIISSTPHQINGAFLHKPDNRNDQQRCPTTMSAASRRYVGPVRYPVTPMRSTPRRRSAFAVGVDADMKTMMTPTGRGATGDRRPASAHRLSLLADEVEQQFFI